MSDGSRRANGTARTSKSGLAKALLLLAGGLALVAFFGYDIYWQALHPFPLAQAIIDESQNFEVIFDMFFVVMGLIGVGAGAWDLIVGKGLEAIGQ